MTEFSEQDRATFDTLSADLTDLDWMPKTQDLLKAPIDGQLIPLNAQAGEDFRQELIEECAHARERYGSKDSPYPKRYTESDFMRLRLFQRFRTNVPNLEDPGLIAVQGDDYFKVSERHATTATQRLRFGSRLFGVLHGVDVGYFDTISPGGDRQEDEQLVVLHGGVLILRDVAICCADSRGTIATSYDEVAIPINPNGFTWLVPKPLPG